MTSTGPFSGSTLFPERLSVPRSKVLIRVLTSFFAAALIGGAIAAPAHADSARLVSAKNTGATTLEIVVHSAAMNRDIPLSVIRPKDASTPRGVLYLLNGAGGGEDAATWAAQTDVVTFFGDKNVWVVTPNKGAFSYYTDWVKDDPKLGRNKWGTFLGQELPAVFNAAFSTSGKNGIAGISSSATSVLNLAIDYPQLYNSVGSYSGCASTSSEEGMFYIRLVIEARGGGDAKNMWGDFSTPAGKANWRANDPLLRAGKLRGKALYLSAATGLPGQHDTLQNVGGDRKVLGDRIVVGGGIEAATRICTEQLAAKLASLRIPATVDRPVAGTHSWPYWQDQLHKSWPMFKKALDG